MVWLVYTVVGESETAVMEGGVLHDAVVAQDCEDVVPVLPNASRYLTV